MKKINANDYKWERCEAAGYKAFGVLTLLNGRTSVGEVEVDGIQFDWRRDEASIHAPTYEKNGIQFNNTFGLRVEESAALELNDGCVLFCITEGRDGGDTFSSADHISMQYYLLTPLRPNVTWPPCHNLSNLGIMHRSAKRPCNGQSCVNCEAK